MINTKARIFNIIIISCILFSASCAKTNQFHPAATDAEKQLDRILKIADSESDWSDMLSYIEQWPHLKPKMKREYNHILTDALVDAWSREEKRMVDEECGGKYIQGNLCGIGFVALTCTQDFNEDYLFRTIEAKDNYVIIQYTWDAIGEIFDASKPRDAHATYKLIKKNNTWLIDGIFSESLNFNLNF